MGWLPWTWGRKKKTFTLEQVMDLCKQIEKFNAGAVDEHLSKHIHKIIKKWLNKNLG